MHIHAENERDKVKKQDQDRDDYRRRAGSGERKTHLTVRDKGTRGDNSWKGCHGRGPGSRRNSERGGDQDWAACDSRDYPSAVDTTLRRTLIRECPGVLGES